MEKTYRIQNTAPFCKRNMWAKYVFSIDDIEYSMLSETNTKTLYNINTHSNTIIIYVYIYLQILNST